MHMMSLATLRGNKCSPQSIPRERSVVRGQRAHATGSPARMRDSTLCPCHGTSEQSVLISNSIMDAFIQQSPSTSFEMRCQETKDLASNSVLRYVSKSM